MATESVTSEIANDLEIVGHRLSNARTMAMLAAKADKLEAREVRSIFEQIWGIIEIARNDVDVARERLEA